MDAQGGGALVHNALERSRLFMMSKIPAKMREKMVTSMRTAWSLFLTLFITQYWQWSDVALYLSPTVSVISSSAYFGLWQENVFKVTYCSMVCGAIGVIVGLSYEMEELQIVLIFLFVFFVNRLPRWDRLMSLLGTLTFLLAAIWPNLTNGAEMGLNAYTTVLALMLMPYCISGMSLLLPSPALAVFPAKQQVKLICHELHLMTTAVIKAFLSSNDMDICCTEFDECHTAIQANLTKLKELTKNVDHERMLFVGVHDMPAALQSFSSIIDVMLLELVGVKDMVRKIAFNRTQGQFVDALRPALLVMVTEIDCALELVAEHFDHYDPFKDFFLLPVLQTVRGWMFTAQQHPAAAHHTSSPALADQADEPIQHYSFIHVDEEQGMPMVEGGSAVHAQFREAIGRLSKARSSLLYSYQQVRREYVFFKPHFEETIATSSSGSEAVLALLKEQEQLASEAEKIAEQDNEEARQYLLKLSVRDETMRLSLRNYGPRGSYMHRLSVVVEYLASFEQSFVAKHPPFDFYAFLSSYLKPVAAYPQETVQEVVQGWKYCVAQYSEATNLLAFFRTVLGTYLRIYSPALKIALASALTISILIYQLMPFLINGGLWMAMVVLIIRQEMVSSSFFVAVQRLEGTVIGAMYAFLVYTIFSCEHTRCGYWVEVPSIVLWVAACGLFRDSTQRGYSATVASFTPIVLLLGTNGNTVAGAWGRIEETFLGIAIFLAVDNLFMPKRIYPAVSALVVACIEHTRLVFNECTKGVEALVSLEDSYVKDSASAKQVEDGTDQAPAEDGVGIYGHAADVRYRSDTQVDELEDSGSMKVKAIEMVPSIVSDAALSPSSQDLLAKCSQHFAEAEKCLASMSKQLALQGVLINLAQYEPDLWHKPFPAASYQRLLTSFSKVYRSGVALNSGSKAFTVVMCQMLRRQEDISKHLLPLRFMIKHIFLISAKADEALTNAHQAFVK